MHLQITSTKYKGKKRKYAKIVRSIYVPGGIPKKKVVLNLGPINSEQDKKKYESILQSLKQGETFVKEKDVNIKNSKEYGVTYTTNKLLEKYGLDKVLQESLSKNKAKFDVFSTVKALIVNRLVKPSSELSAYDWIKNDYSEEIDVKKQDLYRSLDYLIDEKDNIEKGFLDKLKSNMNLDTSIVRYDLTSSYFEGKRCEIAFHGYSRDHRPDRKQIVVGLVMCDGIPIYHEVYEGNTVDKTTLKTMVSNLKQKLGIKEPIFVGDRGMITEPNLEELEKEDYDYILGVQRRNNNIAKECLTKDVESKTQNAREIKKIFQDDNNKNKNSPRKYILCFDNETKQERLKTLDEIRIKTERELMKIQKKKTSKENLMKKVSDVLGKNERLFNITLTEESFNFSLNKKNWDYERNIAGKFLLVTNTDLTPTEVMKEYKKQQEVENAFDEIKNFINIRPIQHSSERRVRAHVFVCVLSYLMESIIEKFSDESARKTIEKLERIRISNVKMEDRLRKKITEESLIKARNIFKKLEVNEPSTLI